MEASEKMSLFLELIWAHLCIFSLVDNKGKGILIPGEGPIQGLSNTLNDLSNKVCVPNKTED